MSDFFKKFLAWAAPAPAAPPTYWLTRFVLLRLLGAVYAIAFLVAAKQNIQLIGAHGLTPLAPIVHQVAKEGNTWTDFWQAPSIAPNRVAQQSPIGQCFFPIVPIAVEVRGCAACARVQSSP